MEHAPHINDALSYLTEAAHLMRASAPESSAHLMRHRRAMLIDNGLQPSDTQMQQACGGCGNIFTATDEISIRINNLGPCNARRKGKSGPMKRKSEPPQAPSRTVCKQLSCHHCKRVTSIKLDKPPKSLRRRPTTKTPSTTPAVQEDTASKGSTNTNSKKRAKNRKQGLQALLAANQNKKSSSLSLSSFMG